MPIRTRVLNQCFNLLYGPLVFLHEPAGACLFGPSWDGRRKTLLEQVGPDGWLLDAGCGGGQLLKHAQLGNFNAIGIEPSRRMLVRAGKAGVLIVQARAESLPLHNDTVTSIVASYPGPWIRQTAVWSEFSRVLMPGGSIVVLLGGTVERGRGAKLRSIVTRVMYGPAASKRITFEPPLPESGALHGSLRVSEDAWGTVVHWCGKKR